MASELKLSTMKIYLLYQTDVWQTKASRVFFGAFSTKGEAIGAAKENDLYHFSAEVVILEVEIDKFEEQ